MRDTANTSLADRNIITIKEDVYSVLHLGMKMNLGMKNMVQKIGSTLI